MSQDEAGKKIDTLHEQIYQLEETIRTLEVSEIN